MIATTAREWLRLDAAAEATRIAATLRRQVHEQLRRKGIVLGLSGGIDSSVTAALAVQAVGRQRVLGLLMPERDAAPDSERLGRLVGEWLGIELIREDVTPILDAAGCYRRRDEAVRGVVPEYRPGDRFKIVLPNVTTTGAFRLYALVVERAGVAPSSDAAARRQARLPFEAYQTIVAATNFKQRVRKMLEYHHADRLRYAVAGTPNRLEFDQGFFVKNGDGAADVKPIAHLYKSQVHQLARHLGVPEEIVARPPTTDTYSLEQSQEEFFFAVTLDVLDACLYAKDHGIAVAEAAAAIGLPAERIAAIFHDIDAKRRAAAYLHQSPLLIESVSPPADDA